MYQLTDGGYCALCCYPVIMTTTGWTHEPPDVIEVTPPTSIGNRWRPVVSPDYPTTPETPDQQAIADQILRAGSRVHPASTQSTPRTTPPTAQQPTNQPCQPE